MNKLFHVLNIVFFTVGITLFVFGSPVVVRADTTIPVYNTGSCSGSITHYNQSCTFSCSSSYSYNYSRFNGDWFQFGQVFFDIDKQPSYTFSGDLNISLTDSSFTYTFEGHIYTIYYHHYFKSLYDLNVVGSYDYDGTTLPYNQFNVRSNLIYLIFGVGSFDFTFPELDIEDADLDIVGLSCYIMNDQTGSIDYKETIRNSFYGFTQFIFNNLSGGIFSDSFLPPILDESPLTGSIVNYVPGVALSWLSPPLDPDITYTVWIDGKSTVNYKTSADPIVNFVSDLKPATSVSYAKLKINESPLSQSGNSFYQYNTNQGFDTILNYIENNSSISPPSTPWQRYSYIGLDTKISRVYIQASKVIDGNNHIGALSYVDIIDGIPSVHEGVTSIDDVTASDPDNGTGNNVGVPYTVSGDTIYTGDTINNGDTYNIYGGAGLVVSGSNPLNTVKTLFNAIIRLVEALYLTHLIKWILVGFTGNPLGDFIL